MDTQIFKNCTVVELASVLAGPSVGMFLAELGANVIKVEHPGTGGDVTRSWKLPGESDELAVSSYYHSINWGKKVVFWDVKKEQDKAKLTDVLKKADIVLVSFKPGDAKKLGLLPEDLFAINSDLMYVSLTGFGADDPRTAYDALLQAETGFMYLNRKPGDEPLKMPVALIDILAAHHLKELLLIAWIARRDTKESVLIETNLFDAAMASLANQASSWLHAGISPEPRGSEHPHIYPYGSVFQCADGKQLVLAIGNNKQFKILCDLLKSPDLAQNETYSKNEERSRNRKKLREKLRTVFQKVPSAEKFVEKAINAKLPVGLIRSVPEALEQYEHQKRFFHTSDGEKAMPALSGYINGKSPIKNLNRPQG